MKVCSPRIGQIFKNANFSFICHLRIRYGKKQVKYGRPRAAVTCIYARYCLQKELFKEQAIKALVDGLSSDEAVEKIDSYHITEIIMRDQNYLRNIYPKNRISLLKSSGYYTLLINVAKQEKKQSKS